MKKLDFSYKQKTCGMPAEGIKYSFQENTAGIDRRWLGMKMAKSDMEEGVIEKNRKERNKGKNYISRDSGKETELIRLSIRRLDFKYD